MFRRGKVFCGQVGLGSICSGSVLVRNGSLRFSVVRRGSLSSGKVGIIPNLMNEAGFGEPGLGGLGFVGVWSALLR